MTIYSEVTSFGGVFYSTGSITPSQKPATLKTQLGKTLIETRIPLKNTTNIVLSVRGIITGLSQNAGQSLSDAIETDRAALIALEDGTFHPYNDGRHAGDFTIIPGSLTWGDAADTDINAPKRFSFQLVEW